MRTSAYHAVQIGAHGRSYAITEFDTAFGGWIAIAHGGHSDSLEVGRRYQLAVEIAGQSLTVYRDGVRVLDTVIRAPLFGDQIGLFAWGAKKIEFDGFDARPKQPRAFVVMPFREPFETMCRDVIVPVASGRFDVKNIGEIDAPGVVTEDILREITESDVVIADISIANENVFYEVGYAHALNKPTILLSQKRELPFDIRVHRVAFYEDSIGGKRQLEEKIRRHLDSVLGRVARPSPDCPSPASSSP